MGFAGTGIAEVVTCAGACTTANADVTFTTTGVTVASLATNPYPLNNLFDSGDDARLLRGEAWSSSSNRQNTRSRPCCERTIAECREMAEAPRIQPATRRWSAACDVQ